MRSVDEMGGILADVILGSRNPRLVTLRQEIHNQAKQRSQCTQWLLDNEDQEAHPRVQLYWMWTSQLWQKVLIDAAQKQTRVEE